MKRYNYVFHGERTELDGTHIDIYSFNSDIVKERYIVEVLHMDHNIYVIQFFLRNHRLSDLRFNLLLKGDNSTHVFYLLNTLVEISREVIKRNPLASFGFMGAPTRKEMNPKKNRANINVDCTVKRTKRYTTYALYVKRYYAPDLFVHIDYPVSSCYLLMNTKNTALTQVIADEYLNNLIETKYNRPSTNTT